MNLDLIWDTFLSNMKKEISTVSFNTWFLETKLIELNDQAAKILVPLHIHKKHLKDNYNDISTRIFKDVTGSEFILEYILEEEMNDSSVVINVDDIGVSSTRKEVTNLNLKFSFDNYVIGNSNKMIHAASIAVAESPGTIYNPFFMYGNSGLGKTHLMHAIGNYITTNSCMKVLYITSEQFKEDFVEMTRKDNGKNNFTLIDEFKKKYRSIDVLIIDDIQLLSNAAGTQQEFFHTFNNLFEDKKQIIISSDRSVNDLKLLEERLKTRFISGLSVNIDPPDYELRINITKTKLENHAILRPFNNDIVEFIANVCQSDVRQIEGAITRIFAYSTVLNVDIIDLNIAKEALKDFFDKGTYLKNKVSKIQHLVAHKYHISIDDMKSKKRTKEIAFPRQVAMYLSRKLTDESFPKLGLEFGGKDHATIMHAVDKITKEIENNNEFNKFIKQLIDEINLTCE